MPADASIRLRPNERVFTVFEELGKVLDPLIGKSMVLYFRKPDELG